MRGVCPIDHAHTVCLFKKLQMHLVDQRTKIRMRERERRRAALPPVRRFYKDLRNLHARSVRVRASGPAGERRKGTRERASERAWAGREGRTKEEEKPFAPLSLSPSSGLTYLLSPPPSRSRG